MRKINRTNTNRVSNASSASKSLTLTQAFARIDHACSMDWLDTDETHKSVVYVSAGRVAKKNDRESFYTLMSGSAIAKIAGVERANEVWNKDKSRYEIDRSAWDKAERAWEKAGSPVADIKETAKSSKKTTSKSSKKTVATDKKTTSKAKSSAKADKALAQLEEARKALAAAEKAYESVTKTSRRTSTKRRTNSRRAK